MPHCAALRFRAFGPCLIRLIWIGLALTGLVAGSAYCFVRPESPPALGPLTEASSALPGVRSLPAASAGRLGRKEAFPSQRSAGSPRPGSPSEPLLETGPVPDSDPLAGGAMTVGNATDGASALGLSAFR